MWGLAGCSFFLTFLSIANWPMPLGEAFFVVGIVLLGSAEVYSDRRRRREGFNREFASTHDFYQAVDKEALRRIREERGVVVAVRELRRQYPSVPLATAAELVKGLGDSTESRALPFDEGPQQPAQGVTPGSRPSTENPQDAPLTREEMQLRWPSATPKERREMMRRVMEHELNTPEGAARDRRRKAIVYGVVALIITGGIAYQLLTR
jgi:hypothetical protein